MDKKITFEEWISIIEETLSAIYDKFSDDGKISVADAISILVTVLKAIAKALKD